MATGQVPSALWYERRRLSRRVQGKLNQNKTKTSLFKVQVRRRIRKRQSRLRPRAENQDDTVAQKPQELSTASLCGQRQGSAEGGGCSREEGGWWVGQGCFVPRGHLAVSETWMVVILGDYYRFSEQRPRMLLNTLSYTQPSSLSQQRIMWPQL